MAVTAIRHERPVVWPRPEPLPDPLPAVLPSRPGTGSVRFPIGHNQATGSLYILYDILSSDQTAMWRNRLGGARLLTSRLAGTLAPPTDSRPNRDICHQFSAECRPPGPARKAMFILSGLPGTIQPVPADNHRRLCLAFFPWPHNRHPGRRWREQSNCCRNRIPIRGGLRCASV